MEFPATADTIVAVASAWRSAPLGIVRLSGPRAFELIASILGENSFEACRRSAGFHAVRIPLRHVRDLPATVFCFTAPRSATGQDVVEVHTPGSLPLLRELTARFIELGARRALPGEFTARAFLGGKIKRDQVDGVLALLRSSDRNAAHQAARLVGGTADRARRNTMEGLLALIARIEAGIDFVDEEGVQFIRADEAREQIAVLSAGLGGAAAQRIDDHRARPHIALAGLPNAGKSSLFNALLRAERAIVSPVIGTTRDVLSAEVDMNGVAVILQDTAGLGASAGEIELAAHVAAESAAAQADLVLWVHESGAVWTSAEIAACMRTPFDRRILILSKSDLSAEISPGGPSFPKTLRVSTVNLDGLSNVKCCVADASLRSAGDSAGLAEAAATLAALCRAATALGGDAAAIHQPELVVAELREACGILTDLDRPAQVEAVLGKIFSQFCVGK